MSSTPDRRTRKRKALRQAISDRATELFFARGFDAVTIDEIAAAADVGRMTVFNHFPRKEDLLFDREQEGRDVVREALQKRDPATSPVEALRRLAHRLVAEPSPYLRFFAGSRRFIETIEGSATLQARARAIRDELARFVAAALCETAGQPFPDPIADLAAQMLLATWAVGFLEAHRLYRQRGDERGAQAAFLDIIDRGAVGLEAALAGTAYA